MFTLTLHFNRKSSVFDYYQLRASDHNKYKRGEPGFDIFTGNVITFPANTLAQPIDFEFVATMTSDGTHYPFWLLPRRSLSKTTLRMSNSVALVGRDDRENLIVKVDNFGKTLTLSDDVYLFQIARHDLGEFKVVVTTDKPDNPDNPDNLETIEGTKRFGLTEISKWSLKTRRSKGWTPPNYQ